MIRRVPATGIFIFYLLNVIACSQEGGSNSRHGTLTDASNRSANTDGSIIYDMPTYKGYRIAVTQYESPNGELYCKWQNLNKISEVAEESDEVAVYFKQFLSYEEPNPNPIEGPYLRRKGWVIRTISCGH